MSQAREDQLVVAALLLLLFGALWDAPLAAGLSIIVLAWALARNGTRQGRLKPKT